MIVYGRHVVVDFEYEASDGNLPDVLCLVAYKLDESPARTYRTALARRV